MLDETGIKLVEQVFRAISSDIVPLIVKLTQWLILINDSKEKKLIRLCWLIEIKGDIEIRRYGFNNILLIVNEAILEKINSADLKLIKRNTVKKEEVNDKWFQLVSESQLGSALEEAEAVEEQIEINTVGTVE